MSYLVLALLLITVGVGVAALAAMITKKEPFYGVVGLVTICCPSAILALVYTAVA
ncbi:hypothetical protein AB0A63_09680 [Lentzea sp. NPDC042327]|uniref:hypothetical protein n=1 Tax=Lentzea sp. NPDC042327 TaxID=3154801 RepID=UPI0033FB2D3A